MVGIVHVIHVKRWSDTFWCIIAYGRTANDVDEKFTFGRTDVPTCLRCIAARSKWER